MSTAKSQAEDVTFVLVHGSWHGGWCYYRVAKILRAAGYAVLTPTLTGLGERSHLYSPGVNASTHVQDIVNVIKFEELGKVVLVGHSYGGQVITGVADVLPGRIHSLVYLDAFVGEDGLSVDDMDTPKAVEAHKEAMRSNGGHTIPAIPAAFFGVNAEDQAFVNRLCTAQPSATFAERLSFTGGHATIRNRFYIFASGWETSFRATYDKVLSQGNWKTYEFHCGHDVMLDKPQETADVLLEAAVLT